MLLIWVLVADAFCLFSAILGMFLFILDEVGRIAFAWLKESNFLHPHASMETQALNKLEAELKCVYFINWANCGGKTEKRQSCGLCDTKTNSNRYINRREHVDVLKAT